METVRRAVDCNVLVQLFTWVREALFHAAARCHDVNLMVSGTVDFPHGVYDFWCPSSDRSSAAALASDLFYGKANRHPGGACGVRRHRLAHGDVESTPNG